jgi:hypothetical protein
MNVVRKIEMILVGLAVSLTAVSHVQARPPPAFQDPVSIASDPQFGDQLKTLRRLVQKNGKRGRNDLCVIGQKDDNGTRKAWAAWVIWKQDHSIILWEPGRTAYASEDEFGYRADICVCRGMSPLVQIRPTTW